MYNGPTELDDTLRAFEELSVSIVVLTDYFFSVFEELEVSIVDLTVANAVLLATQSEANKTDICDRQIHN
jgi:hypothetical protein